MAMSDSYPTETVYPSNTGVPMKFTTRFVMEVKCSVCGASFETEYPLAQKDWVNQHATDHLRWTLNASKVDPKDVYEAEVGETFRYALERRARRYLHYNGRIFDTKSPFVNLDNFLCRKSDLG